MIEGIPLWAVVLDYVLGMIMWTLIARFGMRLFLPEDSTFFFNRFFVRVDASADRPVPPDHAGFPGACAGAALRGVVLLHLPLLRDAGLLGYSVIGMLSFPLEGQIAQGIYYLGRSARGAESVIDSSSALRSQLPREIAAHGLPAEPHRVADDLLVERLRVRP